MKRAIIQPLVTTVPFSLLKQMGSRSLLVVYYHLVSDEIVPHTRHLYRHKGIRQFIDDLDFLAAHYTPVALPEVLRGANCRNGFLMTFDDGLRETYDVIAPILVDKGIPATFFVSSAFIDNEQLCYQHQASVLAGRVHRGISRGAERDIRAILSPLGLASAGVSEGILGVDYRRRAVLDRIAEILQVDFRDYLRERRPYLTSAQIRTLIGRGFTIGAHSIDHPYYSALSLAEQLEQTLVSTKGMREKFSLPYGAFAFPHNDTGVTAEFFATIRESGLIDITFGTGGMLSGHFESHRQRVSLEKPVLPARDLIAWQYLRRYYDELRHRRRSEAV